MTGTLPGTTIIPWLLGGLALLAFLTLSVTFKSWREAKRSPYFFLRREAAKRMQSYMLASSVLLFLMLATTAYAWQTPAEMTPREALISHAKPSPVARLAVTDVADAADEEAAPTALEIDLLPTTNRIVDISQQADLLQQEVELTLPEEFDRFEPTAELNEATALGSIAFSTEIDDEFQAIDPKRRFVEGFFTIYATFSYDGMADGMEWAWVWRLNGEVIDGGNQIWAYGPDGPGYIFFRPEEGFQIGEYTLDVWVNGELFTQANLIITDGISASN